MKPIKKVMLNGKAILLATTVLAGAVAATGCNAQVKASGISIDSLEVNASGDESVDVSVNTVSDSSLSSDNEVTETLTSELVYSVDLGLGDHFRVPQVNIDTDEIAKLNNKIVDDVKEFAALDPDPTYECSWVDYEVFNGISGIYSIVIDLNYDGWGGNYEAFTFSADGHVLSNSEVIRLFGISDNSFYNTVRAALIIPASEYECNGQKAIVNGMVNTDYEYADLVDESLSGQIINLYMPIMINNDGKLCVCLNIVPIADPHDSEYFYTVPEGQKIDVVRAG